MKKTFFTLFFPLLFVFSFFQQGVGQGTTTVVSDTTWQVTTNTSLLTSGWNSNPAFNATAWSKPGSGKTTGCYNTAPVPLAGSQFIWAPTVANNQMVFMRKVFFLPSNNISSYSISVNADDLSQVYLNGVYIGATSTKGVTKVFNTTSIKSALKCGNNVIAVIARNIDACAWVSLKADISWLTPVTVSLPKEVCNNTEVKGYAQSGACQNCISNMTWTVSPASTTTTTPISGSVFTYNFATAGTYTVTLSYTNTCEKKDYQQTFTIVVKQCCTVDYVVTAPEKICLRDTLKLSAMATKCLDCVKDAKWLKDTTLIGTGNMIKTVPTTVGTYYYTFTYFNTCENKQVSIKKAVIVYDCCVPYLKVPERVCLSDKTLLHLYKPANCADCFTEFSWTVSQTTYTTGSTTPTTTTTTIGTTDSVYYSFPAVGYYTVCLKYYNKCTQKTETVCRNVSVADCCTPKIYGPTEICKGTKGEWKLIFPTDACIKCVGKVYWKFSDSSTYDSTGIADTHVFNTVGNYVICAKVIDSCNPNAQTLPVCINVKVTNCDSTSTNPCNVKMDWTYKNEYVNNTLNVLFNSTATNTTAAPIVAYHWNFGDGTWSSQQNPNHIYTQPGIYKVCLTVYADLGNGPCDCKLTLCKEIFVALPQDLTTLSSKSNETIAAKLPQLESYPNPFEDNFTLDLSIYKEEELQNANLEVYDALGRLVKTIDTLTPQELNINAAKLNAGIYHINIIKEGKVMLSTKVVKSDF